MKGDTIHQALGIKVDGKSVGKSAEMVAIEQAYLTNNYIILLKNIFITAHYTFN